MMNEIGSEFWDVPLSDKNNFFDDTTRWYLSGRSALNAILDDILQRKECKTAYLPSWCCDSMIKPFLAHGIKVSFYPIYFDDNNHLVQWIDDVFDSDMILVMDYFGFHNHPALNCDSIIIRDVTHSLFSGITTKADYIFGSLRKWAGFWTGGFAWSKNGKLASYDSTEETNPYIIARKKAMCQKADYLKFGQGDKSYLTLFQKAEEWLDSCNQPHGATNHDILAVQKLDIAFIRKKRRENAEFLLKSLHALSFVDELKDDECPLFVPVFIKDGNRTKLRQFLIDKKIYCPVHWPVSKFHNLTPQTRQIYDEELSIICDQRYSLGDMERICSSIEEFFKVVE